MKGNIYFLIIFSGNRQIIRYNNFYLDKLGVTTSKLSNNEQLNEWLVFLKIFNIY